MLVKTVGAILAMLGAATALHVSIKAQFDLKDAATVSIAPAVNGNDNSNVFVTTFAAFGGDSSYILPDFRSSFSAASLKTIDTSVAWPNEAKACPFNSSLATIAGGFFANPSKATGRVSLLAVDSDTGLKGAEVQVTQDKKEYFYHHAEWVSVGARLQGLVSARVTVPTVGAAQGELVLLTPSNDDYLHATWTESVLISGPDVFFTVADITNNGSVTVIAAQFFTAKALVLYDFGNSIVNATGGTAYTIDDSEDAGFFDVQFVDVNGDGNRDVLATTNTASGKGGVFVYQLTGDYRRGPSAWSKHELATGYKPFLPFLPGRGAPGSVSTFFPNGANITKPWILLSGDDAGTASLLVPSSEDASSWTYQQTFLYNSTGTVGSPVAVNGGDGLIDVVVPDYHQGKMLWLNVAN
eukprot:TRINITY_DN6673_c0_g1_i1.p1 TRINITY_DN6673_c0_g1~~TRINITY_DN6673_c0_g1_i1.p1  ORF type:complete len:411 (+),score=88.89 TRINITY_DN6673_c0_g1_i1:116-1348(+)